jgi:hypothetical protein
MTCNDDAHPISGHGRVHAPNLMLLAHGTIFAHPATAGPLAPGVAAAQRSLRFRHRAAGVGARAGHRLRFSLPAGSDRLAQPTRSGRSVPRRRVHSLSVVAARKLRSRLLRRPQTVDSAPPSSASIRCLRRRNVASSIPMAASSSSLLCCPLVGHETRRRTLEHARIRSQIELAAARPCAKSQTGGCSGVRTDSSSRRRSAW